MLKTLSSKNRIQCPLKTGFTVQKKRIAHLGQHSVINKTYSINVWFKVLLAGV